MKHTAITKTQGPKGIKAPKKKKKKMGDFFITFRT